MKPKYLDSDSTKGIYSIELSKKSLFRSFIMWVFTVAIITFLNVYHASSVNYYDLSLWIFFGLVILSIRIYIAKNWTDRNNIFVENFKVVRLLLTILTGGLYVCASLLFYNEFDAHGRVAFLAALFLVTFLAAPVLIGFFFAYTTLCVEIWGAIFLINNKPEDNFFILLFFFCALVPGLFLCKTLNSIFISAFNIQQKYSMKESLLSESSKHLKLFFLAANHDLSQPLTSIRYGLRNIVTLAPGNTDVQQCVDMMKTASDTLSRLISDIIHFEKISSGISPINLSAVSVQSIFDSVISQMEGIASDRGIGIWARETNKIIYSDRFIIERILRNLVENSLRNTIYGRVIIAARAYGDFISIEVWDTGLGIDEENIDSVFNLFHQSKRSSETMVGHGIGLTIVKSLVDKIGATISIKSKLNRGTVVKIRIPIVDYSNYLVRIDIEDTIHISQTSASLNGEDSRWDGLHIALVEDNKILRQSVALSFKEKNAEVTSAKNSKELIKKLGVRVKDIDVLVTDWDLGSETGFSAKIALNQIDGFHAHWIVISGNISEVDAAILNEGKIPFLRKPFPPERLNRLINEIYLTRN